MFCAYGMAYGGHQWPEVRMDLDQVQDHEVIVNISQDGIEALYRRECSNGQPALTAYNDGSGNLTIGCGHAGPDVTPGMTITREQADALFRKDIAPCEEAINETITVPLRQNQFDALCSFTFNVGVGAFEKSTLAKRINAKASDTAIAAEFARWNESGGQVNKGLVNRRNSEIGQWARGAFVSSATVQVDPPPSKWAQFHNWLKGVGSTCLGIGIGAPDLQNAGTQFQGLATVSHYFAYMGVALIVAGIIYNLVKPKS